MQMDTGEARRGGRGSGRYSSRGRGRGGQYTSDGGSRYGGSGGGGGGGGGGGSADYYQSNNRGPNQNRGGYAREYNQSYGNFDQGGYRGGGRRGYWGGRGGRGSHRGSQRGDGAPRQSRGPHRLPDDVEALSELTGHTKKVTCMVLDQNSGQLFTGSHDESVRIWSCTTGECTSVLPVGGEVDSMLVEGGYLFVGVKLMTGQGIIKVWNMSTNQQASLEGHTGRVQCLAAAGGMLFSGGQDQSIRVWKLNNATGGFECAAVLRVEVNGHSSSVSSLCVSHSILFSGDAQGNVKVWDLGQGTVKQTLERAHSDTSHPAIMSMLIWEGHLITGSLDGYIKVWEPADPATGLVISPTPAYVFPEREKDQHSSHSSGGYGRGGRGGRGGYKVPNRLNGVLALCGVADSAGRAVVMASYNGESAIKLWELPSFSERGILSDVSNVRSMAGFAAGRLMLSGDEVGRIKVWRWKETPLVAAGFPATQ